MFAALNSFLTRAVSGYFLNKSLRFRSSASAYLNRTASAAISTYTVSMWVKRGTLTSTYQYLFSHPNSGNTDGYGLAFNITTDTLYYYNGTAQATTAAYRDPAAWYHIVFSNNAGSFTLYVNGVSVKTGTATAIPSGVVMNLGRYGYTPGFYFDGEQAEVNFVDGQALAPTAFGASSTYNQWLPIKYAGTYGTNGFYLPFSATSATSYAGSFNGSNQYLSMPLNAGLTLGSGNFTIEAWIYKSTSGTGEVFGKTNNNYAIDCQTIAGNYAHITLSSNGTTTTNIAGATALATNTWYHVAWVRSGTTINIYLNGVLDGTGTFSGAIFSGSDVDASTIGARGVAIPDTWFNGYISNLRVVKGTAVYTANFIPPTAALTAITNTSLLTLQSSTIVDNSGNSISITNNNTVVTSVQSPFGMPTIAADSSGNANNWTPNNISLTAGSTYDSLTDVPTLTSTTVANYAVLNPLQIGGTTISPTPIALTNGNLAWSYNRTSSGAGWISATISIPSTGKWYFEYVATGGSPVAYSEPGVMDIATPKSQAQPSIFRSYYGYDGTKNSNGVYSAYGAAAVINDILSVAIDMDNGALYFGKNGTWLNSGVPTSGASRTGAAFTDLLSTGVTWMPMMGVMGNSVATGYTNFGQQPWQASIPSGFLPLNTFNI